MVSLGRCLDGINLYADTELAPKLQGTKKFLLYMFVPMVNKQATELILRYKDNPLFTGMVDSENNIDIDSVYSMAKDAIQHTHKLEMFGFVFDESDIDKLYRCIVN